MFRDIRAEKGLTLLEILVVVGILAVMLAVGVPNMTHYIKNNNLKTAARNLQSDFLELKLKAVSENRVYRLTFSGSSYTISRCNNVGESPCTSGFTTVSTTNVTDFGSDISISGNNFGSSYAQFETRGTVTAGTATLLNSRGSTAAVTVNFSGKTYVKYTLQ